MQLEPHTPQAQALQANLIKVVEQDDSKVALGKPDACCGHGGAAVGGKVEHGCVV
jgi:hypothetical protein